ncbi:HAD-IIA family hydrolase [Paenibacillus sp. GCM10027626]|uniref:HAD-IIA family hydrolase n=1 Tax=Paenibacillus sp. GCM10027626 TaxID=3273411 RepID=UPI00363A0380
MKGFIFDLDGTVYLGDQMLDGASDAIRTLRERGDKVVFLTNKPIATRASYAHKLTKMGIPASVDEIVNSSLLVALYLKGKVEAGEQVLVIGEEPIRDELRQHNIAITDTDYNVRYVVLSWDREFTYDKLNLLYQAAIRGAFIIASNPDRTCPLLGGEVPDTGALIGAIEGALGRPIDLVVGKPSPIAASLAVEYLGLDYADCYMVGDRLETDIRMGNSTGMHSVLVLTGVSTKEMADQAEDKPAFILNSIKEIVEL